MVKRVASWSGLLLVLLLSVLALIYFTRPEAATSLSASPPASGWFLGNPDAPVTIVEYSDYQCPICARYHHIIKRLTEEFGSEFQLVFRHYPLRNHAYARLAARSSEAAGRQGKFWEMNHLLFERQKEWSEKSTQAEVEGMLVQYATSLNLDVEQFQSDLHSQAIIDKVTDDYESGRRSGVTGTPTFFLNNQKVTPKPRTYEAFKALISQSKSDSP